MALGVMAPGIAGSWRGDATDRGTKAWRLGSKGYDGNRLRICKVEYIVNGDKKMKEERCSLQIPGQGGSAIAITLIKR
jgi:hypothetical protein